MKITKEIKVTKEILDKKIERRRNAVLTKTHRFL